jgi:hypothetical protein
MTIFDVYVQAVIDWKWNRFCRRLLLWELAVFLLWLVSFSIFTIAFQVGPLAPLFH